VQEIDRTFEIPGSNNVNPIVEASSIKNIKWQKPLVTLMKIKTEGKDLWKNRENF